MNMERKELYNKKRQEILDLLDVIKAQAVPLEYFVWFDIEEQINLMTFLAVKLRQIAG